jgi:hypothetical protein
LFFLTKKFDWNFADIMCYRLGLAVIFLRKLVLVHYFGEAPWRSDGIYSGPYTRSTLFSTVIPNITGTSTVVGKAGKEYFGATVRSVIACTSV